MRTRPSLAASAFAAMLIALGTPFAARAFCGFYVGKTDAALFNEASQVAIVRDGDRTVLTMSNDYKGALTDFALVVPVPTVLGKDQIHVGERAYIERLDAYSGPRLVEYYDPDPCAEVAYMKSPLAFTGARSRDGAAPSAPARSLGVTVEAKYTIGEYDILILSAKESDGLETWLRQSGYKIPAKSAAALAPYIRQDMKFFVAKVNLKGHQASGFNYLRPLQIAYESPKFMLPIRLGMANARGPQDLVVYALTRGGRVESTNYRTVKVPTGMDVPLAVKDDFGGFYKAVFEESYRKENQRGVLTEYAWNMSWCDPCAAPPLSSDELRQVGVFWLDDSSGGSRRAMAASPTFLTRLHVRYDAEHFPEDLVFQQTGDQANFQARYVLRHPFEGSLSCSGGERYRRDLEDRREREGRTLAEITGWNRERIQRTTGVQPKRWYQRLWK